MFGHHLRTRRAPKRGARGRHRGRRPGRVATDAADGGGGVSGYTLDVPTWPSEFKHLTAEQAWGFASPKRTILGDLSDDAKKELAGLSSFGKSGDQAEMLRQHVDMFTLGDSTPNWDTEHVRSGLRVLKVADPEQNSGIPGYDPWAE